MHPVVAKVICTVNAPYGAGITCVQLAAEIADMRSVTERNHMVFAFLSDVSAKLQREFIEEMGVDLKAVMSVADGFSGLAGYALPLAHK